MNLILLTVLSGVIARPIHVPIVGVSTGQPIHHRRASKNDGILGLTNVVAQYEAIVQIGTPSQSFRVAVDTGSSDLWVISGSAGTGDVTCAGPSDDDLPYSAPPCLESYVFNPDNSSSFASKGSSKFSVVSADQTSAEGGYAQDTVHIGGFKLTNATFGLATKANSTSGVLGIGPASGGGASDHANIPAQLKAQKLIKTNSYSLWLNDLGSQSGSLLFGGVDQSKYFDKLEKVPVVKLDGKLTIQGPAVIANSISVYEGSQDSGYKAGTVAEFSLPAVLDTGSAITRFPREIFVPFIKNIGFGANESTNAASAVYFKECDDKGGLVWSFSGIELFTPFQQLLLPWNSSNSNPAPDVFGEEHKPACFLPFAPTDEDVIILGNSVLRSMYVVYDFNNF